MDADMTPKALRRSIEAAARDMGKANGSPRQRAEIARGGFMVRVGGVGRSSRRCEYTAPLFPLWLILDADGTLTDDMRGLVKRTQA
jgi:hypothetical protein